jgi:elongation factor P--(R)-beta-lysine ligase
MTDYNDQPKTGMAGNWQSKASKETLMERALMLKNIRAFFDARDVIEVETPLLSRYSTTDPHLDSLHTCFRQQDYYLSTSPEYGMKRLLAQWRQPIYQICKAFRDDELGANHNPEFTMLEWYRPGYDMQRLMDEIVELVTALFENSSIAPAFEHLSYQRAFESIAGFDPHQVTSGECLQYAVDNRVEVPQGLSPDVDVNEWLDWLLTQVVLPAFKRDSFTFLYDYPAAQCALAKIETTPGKAAVAKRFELFFGEVELANGFFELTDADEQLSRFRQENQRRIETGKEAGRIDENLIAALQNGLPDCSGVALGVDRLLMVLTGVTSIDRVLSFSWCRA